MPASLLDLIKSRNFTEAHKTFQKVMEQKLQAALNEEKKCLTTEAHDDDWDDKDPDNANRGKRCLECGGSINAQQETKFCSPSCQRKYKGVKEGASVFKCQECGKKFSREVDECPKCGSSDIDVLNESKLHEAHIQVGSKVKVDVGDGDVWDGTVVKAKGLQYNKSSGEDVSMFDVKDSDGKVFACSLNDMKLIKEAVITESKFRIYYEDGTEEEFTGSASEVRKKVKDSKKAVDDVETIG